LGGQAGSAFDAIAAGQITPRLQLHVLQAQGWRQAAGRQEFATGQAQLGRQICRQSLHPALQTRLEVTAAVRLQLQAALQLTTYLQRHLPWPAIDLRQLQAPTQCQRPVALRGQTAADIQAQVITLQGKTLQLDALLVPAGDQLQVAQLRLTIHTQLAQLDVAQLQAQRQIQP